MKRIIPVLLFILSAVLLLNSCALLPAAFVFGAIGGLEQIDESFLEFSAEISDTTEEYGAAGISLTLPDDFWVSDKDNCDFCCISEYADVYAWKDEIDLDEAPVPLNQYLDLFIDCNDLNTEVVIGEDNLVYCIAEEEFYDADGRVYYFVFPASDAYVIVAIAFFIEDAELVEPHVMDWAKSVQIVK